MSSRFTRADPRDDLFSSYNRSASPSKSKNKTRASPYNASISQGYGYPGSSADAYPGNGSGSGGGGLYPGGSAGGSAYGGYGVGGGRGGNEDGIYRSATPNSRGQYSAAVLDELESQNDEHVGVLTGKVKMLKDVCFASLESPISPPFLFIYLMECLANVEIVNPPHRRRNPRLHHPRREDERPV